jgi:hypothetical protein
MVLERDACVQVPPRLARSNGAVEVFNAEASLASFVTFTATSEDDPRLFRRLRG